MERLDETRRKEVLTNIALSDRAEQALTIPIFTGV